MIWCRVCRAKDREIARLEQLLQTAEEGRRRSEDRILALVDPTAHGAVGSVGEPGPKVAVSDETGTHTIDADGNESLYITKNGKQGFYVDGQWVPREDWESVRVRVDEEAAGIPPY